MGELLIRIRTEELSIDLEAQIPSYPTLAVNHQRVLDELDLAYERAKRMVLAAQAPKENPSE